MRYIFPKPERKDLSGRGTEVYRDMDQWTKIRVRIRQGEKKSEILKETGMHWKTLEKILTHPEPPGYRMKSPRPESKLGPYLTPRQKVLSPNYKIERIGLPRYDLSVIISVYCIV